MPELQCRIIYIRRWNVELYTLPDGIIQFKCNDSMQTMQHRNIHELNGGKQLSAVRSRDVLGGDELDRMRRVRGGDVRQHDGGDGMRCMQSRDNINIEPDRKSVV